MNLILLMAVLFGADLFAEPFAFAGSTKEVNAVHFSHRLEWNQRNTFAEKSGASLRPNRVYVTFMMSLKKWVYSLTDKAGRLSSPGEALLPGTILRGERIGGDTGKFYVLGKDSLWQPTKLTEEVYAWVSSHPPAYRRYVPLRQPASK